MRFPVKHKNRMLIRLLCSFVPDINVFYADDGFCKTSEDDSPTL